VRIVGEDKGDAGGGKEEGKEEGKGEDRESLSVIERYVHARKVPEDSECVKFSLLLHHYHSTTTPPAPISSPPSNQPQPLPRRRRLIALLCDNLHHFQTPRDNRVTLRIRCSVLDQVGEEQEVARRALHRHNGHVECREGADCGTTVPSTRAAGTAYDGGGLLGRCGWGEWLEGR
jgi:hypothetical protein